MLSALRPSRSWWQRTSKRRELSKDDKKRGFRLIVRIISIEGENPAFKDKKISGYLLLATGNGGWEEGSHV